MNTDNPQVSVIIPVYNSQRFVRRALDSVLNQTYQNLEVVVIDDGSTDATAEVIQGLGDPRIVYLHQKNQGQGPARNNGIRRCTGEYVTFLDSDDYYLPEKIAREVEFLRSNREYQVVYCNALHFHSDRPAVLYKNKGQHPSGNILPVLLHTSLINLNTAMMERGVLEKSDLFNETRYFPEEWELWLKIALAGYSFGYLDEDLVFVEWREDSNTTFEIQPVLKQNTIEMIENLIPEPIEIDGRVYDPAEAVRQLKLKLAIAYLVNGQKREFFDTLREWSRGNMVVNASGGLLTLLHPNLLRRLWILNREWRTKYIRKVGR